MPQHANADQEVVVPVNEYWQNKPHDQLWLARSAHDRTFCGALSRADLRFNATFRQNRDALAQAQMTEKDTRDQLEKQLIQIQNALLECVQYTTHHPDQFWQRYREVTFKPGMTFNQLIANLANPLPKKADAVDRDIAIRYIGLALGQLFGINAFGSIYHRSNADVLRLAGFVTTVLLLVASGAALAVPGISVPMAVGLTCAVIGLAVTMIFLAIKHSKFSSASEHRERHRYPWCTGMRASGFTNADRQSGLAALNSTTVRNAVVAELRGELEPPAGAVTASV